jgi:hypothetical protein
VPTQYLSTNSPYITTTTTTSICQNLWVTLYNLFLAPGTFTILVMP